MTHCLSLSRSTTATSDSALNLLAAAGQQDTMSCVLVQYYTWHVETQRRWGAGMASMNQTYSASRPGRHSADASSRRSPGRGNRRPVPSRSDCNVRLPTPLLKMAHQRDNKLRIQNKSIGRNIKVRHRNGPTEMAANKLQLGDSTLAVVVDPRVVLHVIDLLWLQRTREGSM